MTTTVKTETLLIALKSVLPFVPNKKMKQKNLQNIRVTLENCTLSFAATDGISIGYAEIPEVSGPEFAFLLSTKEDQQKSLETILKAATLEDMVFHEDNGILHFHHVGLSLGQDTPIAEYPDLSVIFAGVSPQPGTKFKMSANQLEKLSKAAKAFGQKNPLYDMVFNGDNQAILAHLECDGIRFKSLLMPDSG
jgi:hypothetical protein